MTTRISRASGSFDRAIGDALRRRRIALGLTQQQFADVIGVSYQQAHKYEKGTNRVAAGRLAVICDALGIDPNELLRDAVGEKAPIPSPRGQLELARMFGQLSYDMQVIVLQIVRLMLREETP
jgi:transcriptional regulator with XRE-family HTH domain